MTTVLAVAGWIAAILGVAAAGLLVLALLALLPPLRAEAEGRVDGDDLSGRFAARWAWGFLAVEGGSDRRIAVRLVGVTVYRLRAGQGTAPAKAPRQERRRDRRRDGRGFPGLRGLRALLRLGTRALLALRLRGRVEGTLGLPDPADTAMAMAALAAAARRPGIEVAVRPDWLGELTELRGRVRVDAWPARVAWVFLRAWWTDPEVRSALRPAR